MAIKPYLIEVIGIDLWHAVEFSRYGCAPIPGLTAVGRAQPIRPCGQKEKPRPLWLQGQIALANPFPGAHKREKTLKNKGFWPLREVLARLLGLKLKSDFVARSEE
jgi:hypothetical protein